MSTERNEPPLDPEAGAPDSFETTDLPWYSTSTGSALVAVGGAGLLGALLMAISTQEFRAYGMTLFLFSPLICGLAAAILYNLSRPVGQRRLFRPALAVVVTLALLCTMGLLIMGGIEGLICVLMAFPVALVMALMGAALGEGMTRALGGDSRRPVPVLAALVLVYPALQSYENENTPPPPPHEVVTQLVVQAPPTRVWAALVQPVQYPERVGLLFRAGVAYPTRTALRTTATGGRELTVAYSGKAVAHLPVSHWVPERELQFKVPVTPEPMKELSPYPRIHAPHLHGYFRVSTGTFRLQPLPGGRTLLEARTVYQHSIGPRGYWQLWSDYLLDDMHTRVLTTLQQQVEHE
ncbi:hypothetical protein MTX78_12600 [Hymenobacter tibetensis]|uniref:SRPBCC family protein n=1 Tax=Hymenobacter tibetensis TaxID=497967 RepID=A0ABY4CSC7_9BACT|nr:hypothetical protein [Hymenobacter tibetensis]UOG72967.1 hypothetical protein MTX78_12600 [Hymenobacter tibetensis]